VPFGKEPLEAVSFEEGVLELVAGAEENGTPPHAYELKVYTPYNQTVALGLGSTRNGRTDAT